MRVRAEEGGRMKPTDEERREVAKRLRVLASHREVDKEMFHDAIGVWPGGCIDGYDPVGVMELADLIEPAPERMCRAEQDYEAMEDGIPDCRIWRCECGEEFPFWRGEKPIYCPACGAKVVDE